MSITWNAWGSFCVVIRMLNRGFRRFRENWCFPLYISALEISKPKKELTQRRSGHQRLSSNSAFHDIEGISMIQVTIIASDHVDVAIQHDDSHTRVAPNTVSWWHEVVWSGCCPPLLYFKDTRGLGPFFFWSEVLTAVEFCLILRLINELWHLSAGVSANSRLWNLLKMHT